MSLLISIVLISSHFANGARIPVEFTEDGKNISPQIEWSGVPPQTKELALIVDDPDAPTPKPWVHWIVYKIPLRVTSFEKGVPSQRAFGETPLELVQGKNSWNSVGYRGPAPPPGKVHHYYFRIYALDKELSLGPGADKETLLRAIKSHTIGTGELIGTYSR